MNNYKELIVWKKSMDLVQLVYTVSKELPESEKYTFQTQITRSALSIPSNIAEGAGRNSKKEFSRFLAIANGSAFELETQLILAQRIFELDTNSLLNLVEEIQKMIYTLNKTLIDK